MIWFFIALIGPLLYATTNYIDKLLLQKYFTEGGVGTILIFSGLVAILALPFFLIADPSVLQVRPIDIATLIGVGISNALVLFFYLKALEGEEVSVAIIFYQLVPVLAYGLGYLLLGETLSAMQFAAMGVIILGTSVVAFEVDEDNRFKLRARTIGFMLCASFCWALGAVLFKGVALEEHLARSLFWEHVTLAIIGIGLFVLVRPYRTHFLEALRQNSRAILSLNVLNEGIYISGNIAMAFAYLLAPVSLVLLANSYQVIFALLIGIALTAVAPQLAAEKVKLRHIGQKAAAIGLTAVGTYLLFTA